MPYYLIQAAYTADALKALIKKPQDRAKVIRPAIEKLGGSLEGFWFAFGDYDAVLIVQAPDNVSAAAFALAAGAGGGVRSIKTTPLMDMVEGLGALKRARSVQYRAPGR
jgi:uncharacterized protein with GYD domain